MDRWQSDPRLRVALSAVLSMLAACSRDGVAPTGSSRAATPGEDVAAAVATLATGSVQLVSATITGAAATTGSTTCALSADGTLVLFSSAASNLVSGDTNGASDLFLRNLATGVTTRVTTGTGGAQLATGGSCGGTTMTPDGRVVAFNSADAGGTVFVKNTQTGALTQASPTPGSVPQVTGFFGGALSDDGSKVLFLTRPQQVYLGAYRWANVVPARLMLRDLNSGTVATLPTDNGNVADGEVVQSQFALSPDGSRVAFISSSPSLAPGDNNGRPDLVVLNLADNSAVLASSTSAGVPASGGSQYWRPAFVSNSQLAFGTGSTSSLGERGYFLKDLASGALRFILRDGDGGSNAMLSADARLAVYSRNYSGFDARIFLRDLETGTETVVSANAAGTPSNGSSTGAMISRDGRRVTFGSSASNLISPRPPRGVFQIYSKSVAVGTTSAQ